MKARFMTGPALVVLLGMVCSGCNSSAEGPPSLTEAAGFTTRVGQPKPFVQETRPADPAYMPVGVAVKRDTPRKSVAEFKALENNLDAKRGSNEAAAVQARQLGATPPPAPPPVPPPL